MADEAKTIREAYMEASYFLERNRVDEAKTTAERLMCHVLGWSRTQLFLRWSDPFPDEAEDRWQKALERRANGEPLQYITGEQEFYGLPFTVGPAVLIPRPETELLVEALLREGDSLWPLKPEGGAPAAPFVADVGTGSGAIAVALAKRRPEWRLAATDISAAALDVARANAERHGAAERIDFVQGDLLIPLIEAGRTIDMLAANPPYIESGEVERLQREVRDHEPRTALDGGRDGLDCYRRIVTQLELLPEHPALVGFEVGHTQAGKVADLLETAGYGRVTVIRDYAGVDRHVLARLR